MNAIRLQMSLVQRSRCAPPLPKQIPQGGGAGTAVCVSEEELLLPSRQTATLEQTRTLTPIVEPPKAACFIHAVSGRLGGQEVAALCSGGGRRATTWETEFKCVADQLSEPTFVLKVTCALVP